MGLTAAAGLTLMGTEAFARDKQQEDQITIIDSFPIVLIGAGPAIMNALYEIRKQDQDTPILVIRDKFCLPYSRRSLIHRVLGEDDDEPTLAGLSPEWIENNNVTVFHDDVVLKVDPYSSQVKLKGRRVVIFKHCLIATGLSPKAENLHVQEGASIQNFDQPEDAHELREKIESGDKTIILIGDNKDASDLADALRSRCKEKNIKLKHILKSEGVYSDMLPPYLVKNLNNDCNSAGIEVIPSATIQSIEFSEEKQKTVVHLDGSDIEGDHVVVLNDLVPLNDFVPSLEKDKYGIVVNSELHAAGNVYVAGEVASHYDSVFGRRRLVGTGNEILSAKTASHNMLSSKVIPYELDSAIYYKLAGNEFSCVGKCESSMDTHGVWLKKGEDWANTEYTSDRYNNGLIYYLDENQHTAGVLLYNLDEVQQHGVEERAVRHLVRSNGTRTPRDSLKTGIALYPLETPTLRE